METFQDVGTARLLPRTFLLRLGVGVAALNLFVLSMAVVSLRQSWRNHQERAEATALNLAEVLDRNVADTFNKADLAVWAVKDEAERTLRSPGNPGDLDTFIRRQHERIPGLLAIRTTNAQGVIDHGSGVGSGTSVNVSDRDHFIRLREGSGAGLVISRPLVGKLTGTWVVILARRLEYPDRRFAGMVHAVIGLDQFAKAFSALDMGAHGSLAIRDLDLGLVARHPEPVGAGTAIGQKVVSREFTSFVQSGRTSGIYRTRTPYDRIRRTFAIRRVPGLPYYVVVGLAEQDYLAGWRGEVIQESQEVVLFACLTLTASWLMRRAWLRQKAAQARLESLLGEVKTLGGMLPICSHCKKIRDDKGYWNQLEAYLNEHIDAEFTHGICPDCAKEAFPKSGKRLGA